MGTGPGIERPGCGVNHTLPSSTEVEEIVELHLHSASKTLWLFNRPSFLTFYSFVLLSYVLAQGIKVFAEIKCQLHATEVFIADLNACSTCFGHHYAHHQELKSIIQWLLLVVFRAVVFQVAGLVWS